MAPNPLSADSDMVAKEVHPQRCGVSNSEKADVLCPHSSGANKPEYKGVRVDGQVSRVNRMGQYDIEAKRTDRKGNTERNIKTGKEDKESSDKTR